MQQQPATAESSNRPPGESPGGRVLVVAPQPFYEDRGTPIAVRYVLEALTQLGYAADVLTYPVGASPPIAGVEYHRCGNPLRFRHVPIGLSMRKLVLDTLLTGSLVRLLREREYIAVHAVEEMAFPALALARRRGIPVIYDMQSSLPEQLAQRVIFRGRLVQTVLRRAERWLLAGADMVMSSAGLAGRVDLLAPEADVREWQFPSRLQPVRPERLAELRRRLDLSDRARVVLYAGTFEKYQGLDALIDAVPAVQCVVPDMVLLLVGGREKEVEEIQRFGQARGINGALRVIPRQPRDAMADYFALADVLVSSRSYGGNLPLKIFDYLAAGRPIVATDIETHRVVLDSSRARLVPPDASGLAEGILSVLTNPDEAARLAQGAHQYATTCLGWDRFLDSIRELYGEIGNGG